MRQIGGVPVGSEHPIALQTMTTTDTTNVAATVEQVNGYPIVLCACNFVISFCLLSGIGREAREQNLVVVQ